jgi:hypothetical protein
MSPDADNTHVGDEFGGGKTIVEITAAHVPALPETGTTVRQVVSDLACAGRMRLWAGGQVVSAVI